jgi:SNF2 family DNA or RNA helicase
MGGCLADDMGLGKTLQALGVLLERAAGGPALVIAPTSVCGNWLAETQRFAPTSTPASTAKPATASARNWSARPGRRTC